MVPPLLRAAHHQFIAHLAGASQERHRGGVDVIFLHLTVLFFNADMQRTGDRIAKILDAERPRRDLGFVDDAAQLADGHFRGGVRHAGDIRRIAAQIRRQHLIVGADTATHVVKAVENIRIQVVFAKAKFGF